MTPNEHPLPNPDAQCPQQRDSQGITSLERGLGGSAPDVPSSPAFMRAALEEARAALEEGEFPVGAVVVRHGAVIARAHNKREALHDPTAHAEVLALREAARVLGGWRLVSCAVYVTLEPCPMCAGAVMLARPALLVFGAADERMGCCGSRYALCEDSAFGPAVPVMAGLLADESRALITEFGRRVRGGNAGGRRPPDPRPKG